jgi:uncharacterized membrane protein YadS
MHLKQGIKFIPFIISIGVFIYGFSLFLEASQSCGSDSCLIHLLYFIAIPIMLISGIASYKLGKKLFRKTEENK